MRLDLALMTEVVDLMGVGEAVEAVGLVEEDVEGIESKARPKISSTLLLLGYTKFKLLLLWVGLIYTDAGWTVSQIVQVFEQEMSSCHNAGMSSFFSKKVRELSTMAPKQI